MHFNKTYFFLTMLLFIFTKHNISALGNKIIIEAENFIKETGGPGNLNITKGRIESSKNACIISWNKKSHSVEWEFDIPENDNYKIVLRYANEKKWNTIRDMMIDDAYPNDNFKKILLYKTGGLSKEINNWYNQTLTDHYGKIIFIKLTKGKHKLKMTNLGSPLNNDGATNFDSIGFLSADMDPGLLGKSCLLPEYNNKIKIKKNGLMFMDPVFEEVQILKNIVYGEAVNEKNENQKLLLDLYKPVFKNNKNLPVLLLIHGGGLKLGSKDEMHGLAMEFSKRGYVCAAIDYRLLASRYGEVSAGFKNVLIDAISAIDWIINNSGKYGMDKNKIFILGESAGGYISLYLGYDDSVVKNPYKKNITGIIDFYGGDTSSDITGNIPLLIIHGDKDNVINYETSENLTKKAQWAKLDHELYTMKNEGHSYYNDHYSRVVEKISRFLYRLTNK